MPAQPTPPAPIPQAFLVSQSSLFLFDPPARTPPRALPHRPSSPLPPLGWAAGVIYFLLLMIVGMFVVLNLFLAVLLSNFSGDVRGHAGALATATPRHGFPRTPSCGPRAAAPRTHHLGSSH